MSNYNSSNNITVKMCQVKITKNIWQFPLQTTSSRHYQRNFSPFCGSLSEWDTGWPHHGGPEKVIVEVQETATDSVSLIEASTVVHNSTEPLEGKDDCISAQILAGFLLYVFLWISRQIFALLYKVL